MRSIRFLPGLLFIGLSCLVALEVSAMSFFNCPPPEFPKCRGSLAMSYSNDGCPVVICKESTCPRVVYPKCDGIIKRKADANGCPMAYCEVRTCPDLIFPICDGDLVSKRDKQGCLEMECKTNICPALITPVCEDGEVVMEDDANRCPVMVCKQRESCPDPVEPNCPNGRLIPSFDENGCQSFICELDNCPELVRPECGSGQELVTAFDETGCQVFRCESPKCPSIPVMTAEETKAYYEAQCGEGTRMITKINEQGCEELVCEEATSCPDIPYPRCDGIVTWKRDANGCQYPECEGEIIPEEACTIAGGDIPYCGKVRSTGELKSYDNLCDLQGDKAVAMYRGACRDEASTKNCSGNYEPVCGKVGAIEKTYNNKCLMERVGAVLVREGACGSTNASSSADNPCGLYAPVCAVDTQTSKQRTFRNTCFAEKYGMQVVQEGRCSSSNTSASSDVCTQDYRPECGEKDGTLRTYKNACYRERSGATFKHADSCSRNELNNQKKSFIRSQKNQELINQFPNCKVIFDGCSKCYRVGGIQRQKMVCSSGSCESNEPAECLEPFPQEEITATFEGRIYEPFSSKGVMRLLQTSQFGNILFKKQ